MKRPPRFQVIKMKVVRDFARGSSANVAKRLNREMRADQRLVYLKHNTLVGAYAYWTAIVENLGAERQIAASEKDCARRPRRKAKRQSGARTRASRRLQRSTAEALR